MLVLVSPVLVYSGFQGNALFSLSLCALDAKFLESEKKKEDKIKIARLKRLAGVVDANFLFWFIDHFKVLINNCNESLIWPCLILNSKKQIDTIFQ